MTAAESHKKALMKGYKMGYTRRQVLVLLSLAERGCSMSVMELVEDTRQLRQTISKTISSYINGEVKVDRSEKLVKIQITQAGVDALIDILNTRNS